MIDADTVEALHAFQARTQGRVIALRYVENTKEKFLAEMAKAVEGGDRAQMVTIVSAVEASKCLQALAQRGKSVECPTCRGPIRSPADCAVWCVLVPTPVRLEPSIALPLCLQCDEIGPAEASKRILQCLKAVWPGAHRTLAGVAGHA